MPFPAYYHEIKNMTEEQRMLYPLTAQVADLREHMESEHGGKPEEYQDDVVGWHKKNWPLCNFVKEYYEGLNK